MSKNKDYIVIPIKHLLRNNKMAKSGDIVKGSAFVNLQDALDRGICKEAEKEEDSEVDLSKMNKSQLLDFAEKEGYDLSEEDKKGSKKSIVEAIISQA